MKGTDDMATINGGTVPSRRKIGGKGQKVVATICWTTGALLLCWLSTKVPHGTEKESGLIVLAAGVFILRAIMVWRN